MQATTKIDDWLILKSFVFLIERKPVNNPGQRGLFYADIKYVPPMKCLGYLYLIVGSLAQFLSVQY